MPERINYILGRGELLTQSIEAPKKGGPKTAPYTFADAVKRLADNIAGVQVELAKLPGAACPGGQAVISMVMHPAYLAKSYYPEAMLGALGLESVGSRAKKITPHRSTKKSKTEFVTTEFFVAGSRNTFGKLAEILPGYAHGASCGEDIDKVFHRDLIKIEELYLAPAENKLVGARPQGRNPLMEIVLHASDHSDSEFVLSGFQDYMAGLGIEANMDDRIHVEGLCFVPVRVPHEQIDAVARFAFLRALRHMPSLRPIRTHVASQGPSVKLPSQPPLDPGLRVAVFDGGVPNSADLAPYVRRYEFQNMKTAPMNYVQHGLAVTSALLFGPIPADGNVATPYAMVDHYRVLDADTAKDPQQDLFPVLRRIQTVLQSGKYSFASLSVGPDLPVDDDEVHVWTAVLDDLLSDGRLLLTVAAGNDGEADTSLQLHRIQPPSDCVNAFSIGACDSITGKFCRAPYSSYGPGRSPGLVKPDVLAFGGTEVEPFWVLDAKRSGKTYPQSGTSFAAPFAMRTALGVRATLGSALDPLAVKALLIHRCEDGPRIPCPEHGWGRVRSDPRESIVCSDHEVYIVYQGTLRPTQWLRATIPVPKAPFAGRVEIAATICYATGTDPQNPDHYTQSGLEVIFRPDANAYSRTGQQHADSKPFFQKASFSVTEQELRDECHKWETCLKHKKRMGGTSLTDPVFDIHYVPRSHGGPAKDAHPVAYAMVISMSAPQVPDLYNQIVARYGNILEVLKPVLQIPIQSTIS